MIGTQISPKAGSFQVRDDLGNVLLTTTDFEQAYSLACSTVNGRLFRLTPDGWQGCFIWNEDRA